MLIWPADDPAEDGPDDGALCCIVEPPDDPSRPMPVPCALAKPVPAISASGGDRNHKRLFMNFSSRVCIARADNEVSCVQFRAIAVPSRLFFERVMNASATDVRKQKAG